MVFRNSIGYVPLGSNHYSCDYSRGTNYEYETLGAGDLRPETNRGSVSIYFQNADNKPTKIGMHNVYDGIVPSELDDHYKDYIFIIYNGKSYLSIEESGNIEVSKSDNIIISGTFNCKAKNMNNPNETITITDGRFAINKSTINSTNFP